MTVFRINDWRFVSKKENYIQIKSLQITRDGYKLLIKDESTYIQLKALIHAKSIKIDSISNKLQTFSVKGR